MKRMPMMMQRSAGKLGFGSHGEVAIIRNSHLKIITDQTESHSKTTHYLQQGFCFTVYFV